MKTNKQSLGKVSITCNGLWDIDRVYDRLCLVHDGFFASYISKQYVPVGIALNDETYWQPVACLRDDIREDYKKLIEVLAEIKYKLKTSRITVKNDEERDALSTVDISVGCEVYVISTGKSWILDKIVHQEEGNDIKEWHLEEINKSEEEIKGIVREMFNNYDFTTIIQNLINEMNLSNKIVEEVNNYFAGDIFKSLVQQYVNDYMANNTVNSINY